MNTYVIPAQAGIQLQAFGYATICDDDLSSLAWIPACAGIQASKLAGNQV